MTPKKSLRVAVLCALTALAANATDEDTGRTKVLMHTFLMELDKMAPYIGSENSLESERAKEIVGSSLTILERKLRTPPQGLKDTPGFRISFGLLSDHVIKTKQVFDRGEFEYARVRLNATTNLCAACHMQAPTVSRFSPFGFMDERTRTVSLDNANFLFVIRRFPEALSMYDRLARGYDGKNSSLTGDQLGEVYRRKLTIFARVDRDPKAAIANLNLDLKNPGLPADVRQNVKDWVTGFSQWVQEKQDPAKMKTPQLIQFVAKNIPTHLNRRIAPSDPQLLNLLRLSGLLYERLYTEKQSPHAQELLYYLAQCERSLAPVYLYSLSEIYLKECIVRYPKKPFAKKCFDAYQEGMRERYFGKPIPEGVQQSMDALKEYL